MHKGIVVVLFCMHDYLTDLSVYSHFSHSIIVVDFSIVGHFRYFVYLRQKLNLVQTSVEESLLTSHTSKTGKQMGLQKIMYSIKMLALI